MNIFYLFLLFLQYYFFMKPVFMKVLYSNTLDNLKVHFEEFSNDDEIKSVIIFISDNNSYDSIEIRPHLLSFKKPIIGGIFPELIFNNELKKEGNLLIGLDYEMKTLVFNLENLDLLNQKLESHFRIELDTPQSLFVFLDSLGSNKRTFLENLYNYFGASLSYLGGGAGSLSFKPFDCIIDNSGFHRNVAVLGYCNKELKLGVAHGWHQISPPLKVTEAVGNKLISLDWQPAFEIYQKTIREYANLTITADNFFDIAKSFPFGMVKLDSEMIIRDPFGVEDNSILIVDEVPEGEYVQIMNGNIDSLIDGAIKAKDLCLLDKENDDESNLFCIDCISRVLYMEEQFQRELDAISENSNVNGVSTIGEIANSGDTFLEIYNKTIVLAR